MYKLLTNWSLGYENHMWTDANTFKPKFSEKYINLFLNSTLSEIYALRRKCPYSELFWSAFFPHSDWIRREMEYLSVFSPNAGKCGKIRTRKTANTNTFYALVTLRTQSECGKFGKNADQNNSEYGQFLRKGYLSVFTPNTGKCGKNADQNNSKYGQYSRGVLDSTMLNWGFLYYKLGQVLQSEATLLQSWAGITKVEQAWLQSRAALPYYKW